MTNYNYKKDIGKHGLRPSLASAFLTRAGSQFGNSEKLWQHACQASPRQEDPLRQHQPWRRPGRDGSLKKILEKLKNTSLEQSQKRRLVGGGIIVRKAYCAGQLEFLQCMRPSKWFDMSIWGEGLPRNSGIWVQLFWVSEFGFGFLG